MKIKIDLYATSLVLVYGELYKINAKYIDEVKLEPTKILKMNMCLRNWIAREN